MVNQYDILIVKTIKSKYVWGTLRFKTAAAQTIVQGIAENQQKN